MDSWYSLLNNHISVDSVNINVYRVDVPITETGHYIVLRKESETEQPNNSMWINNPVLVTEVVARFKSGELINDTVASSIDSQIAQLLFTTPATNNLPAQTGIQIVSVKRKDSTDIHEDDGVTRFHRIVTRNYHTINQI